MSSGSVNAPKGPVPPEGPQRSRKVHYSGLTK